MSKRASLPWQETSTKDQARRTALLTTRRWVTVFHAPKHQSKIWTLNTSASSTCLLHPVEPVAFVIWGRMVLVDAPTMQISLLQWAVTSLRQVSQHQLPRPLSLVAWRAAKSRLPTEQPRGKSLEVWKNHGWTLCSHNRIHAQTDAIAQQFLKHLRVKKY